MHAIQKKNGAKFLSEQLKMNNKKEIYVCATILLIKVVIVMIMMY